jgi:hypothetical protein
MIIGCLSNENRKGFKIERLNSIYCAFRKLICDSATPSIELSSISEVGCEKLYMWFSI